MTTLRNLIESLNFSELKTLIAEHAAWEKNMSIPMDAELRKIAKQHYGDDSLLLMDRVVTEAYRAIALKFIEGPKPYMLLSTDEQSHIIHTSRQDEIHLQEKTKTISLAFFNTLSLARQFYYKHYDGGLDEELAEPRGS